MLRHLLLAVALNSTLHIDGKVLIWDLGSTLFQTSQFTFARKVGLSKFIEYMALDLRSPNIKPEPATL